tara:strand:+ start:1249 stop:1635 length:387 start_codon:yes stop_codon:yes gene_type:complete
MRPTIEDALFDYATIELHDALSELVETSKGALVVRRMAEHRDAVLVDIDEGKCRRPINRFQFEYAKETIGNRATDGVNATKRQRPTTVTAYAGGLNAWRLVATFENRDPLEMYEWMLRVASEDDTATW